MQPYQQPPPETSFAVDPAKNQTGSVTQDIGAVADQAKKEAKERAARAYDDVKKGARQAFKDTTSYAKDVASGQKSALVTKLDEYKGAALAASEKLDSEDDKLAAAKVRKIATGLDNVAGYLRDAEPSDLYDEASRLARKHPEIAFGTLFIAGLGIARFLKASADERRKETHGAPRAQPGYGSSPHPAGYGASSSPFSQTPNRPIS